MPTPKRKPMPKPVVKRPAKQVTVRHVPTPPRPAKPHLVREATHAGPAPAVQKVSPPMMTEAAEETRGTGTGENANQQRNRPADNKPPKKHSKADTKDDVKNRIKQEMDEARKNNQAMVDDTGDDDDDTPEPEPVTEYPEGDPDKGALDPENPDRPIAHRDRRAYLVRQAERNQAANDQLNAMQTAQNARVYKAMAELQTPEYMLETSMQTAMTALKAHDPDVVQAKHEEMAKRQKAKQDREDKKNGTK